MRDEVKSTHDLETARHTLDSLRRSQLRLNLTSGSGYALALIIIVWLISFILEASLRFTIPSRSLLLVGAILLTLILVFLTIFFVLSNPRLRPGRFAEEWWALELGRSAPDRLRDRLLNAIQVSQCNPPSLCRGRDMPHPSEQRPVVISEKLSAHALYLAVAELGNIDTEKAVDKSARRKSLLSAAISIVIIITAFAVFPGTLTDAVGRLMHPRTTYAVPHPFTLSIDPAGGWAYRGEPVVFGITADGLLPDEVEFVHYFDDGKQMTDPVPLENGHGRIEFDGFSAHIRYFARSNGITSTLYRLEIVTRPQVAELQYRIFPPKYCRLPAVIGRENVGDIEVLPGSSLELTVRSTKPLEQAWLMFLRTGADSSAIDSLPLNVSGLTGTVRMNIMNEGSYLIRLLDNQGHSNHDPINYHIRLLNDHYPLVRIAFPPGDVVLGDEMKLPLRIEADDDYGVSRLSLAYRIMGQDTTINYTPLNVPTPQVQNVTIEQIWDMSQLQLFLGDVLEYWAIVWDNDVISGPKRGESERRLVSLPSIEEIVSGIEQSEEAGFEQAERTLETARELQEKVSEIIDEMRRNPDMDWEKRRDIESALDQQKEIDQQVDELARRIEDLVERLEKHDLLTAETLEKYSELQKLIDEISSPELKAAMDKLREAMETQDPDKIRQALEQFDMNREEFLERIERSLNILQQLQLERKMDELVRLTEELLHQQEEIIDQIDRADSENLQQRQESLARSMDVVNNCLKETSQLADKAEEQVLAAELDSLLAFSEETDISGKMSDAAKALSENSMRQARNASEQAARALAELSAALKQSSTELKERRKSQLAGKLRRLAEELLYISKDQEDLAVESHEIGTSSPRYRSLAGQQEDIRQTLQEIIARMFAVSQETFFITPDLGASLGKASTEIEKAIDGFSDRRPRSVASPQQKALGEINRSALKLLNLLSDLESASSSSGYEEMMRQLAEMASQQQGLNDQSMMMPGGDGEQMMPGGSDQLSRMAAQQRALQEAMQQLSEDAEGMQEILGDLEGVAKSMGEVAEDFDDKTIDARTRRLQRQIVSRLLDATRSAKEREYSRRRESKTGRDLTRKPPPALRFDQDREQLRRDLLRAMQEGYTRDYRELIRNYFQALEKLEKQYENQR